MNLFGFGHARLGDLIRYRDGVMPPSEKERAEAHMRWCDPCRAKLDFLAFVESRYGEAMSAVPAMDQPHLTAGECSAYLDRSQKRRERDRIELHLARCADCLTELIRVRKFLTESSPARHRPSAAALQAVLAMGTQPLQTRPPDEAAGLLAMIRHWVWPEPGHWQPVWVAAGAAAVVALATFSVMQWNASRPPDVAEALSEDPLSQLVPQNASMESRRRLERAGGLVAQGGPDQKRRGLAGAFRSQPDEGSVRSGPQVQPSTPAPTQESPPVTTPDLFEPMTTIDWYRLGETGSALATPVVYALVPKPGLLKMAGDYDVLLGKARPPNAIHASCRHAAKDQVPALFALASQGDYEDAVTRSVAPALGSCLNDLFGWTTDRRRDRFYFQLGYVNFHLFYLPKLWENSPDQVRKAVAEKLLLLEDMKDAGQEAVAELCPSVKESFDRLGKYAGTAADPLAPGLSFNQGKGIQEEAVKLRTLILEGKHRC
jgi:hypothetical protein